MEQTIADKRRENMAKARAKAAANREARRVQAPEVKQTEPAVNRVPRAVNGRAVAMGRDGQELTRRRVTNSDAFFIDPSWIPQDWDWQWNVVEVLGQQQMHTQLAMAENGWRAVTADRLPGVFMPAGYKGEIVRDGLRLEERPMSLSREARAEEASKARKLVTDQQEQLMLSRKGALGDGFSDDPKYRGTGGMARQQIAPAADIPRPRLEIDPSA